MPAASYKFEPNDIVWFVSNGSTLMKCVIRRVTINLDLSSDEIQYEIQSLSQSNRPTGQVDLVNEQYLYGTIDEALEQIKIANS